MKACLAKGIDIKKLSSYELLAGYLKEEQIITECNDDPQFSNGMDGYQFFELLEKGDEIIKKVYEEYIYNVAKLVFTIQVFYDPEKIVIGGGISRQKRLITDVQEKTKQLLANFNAFYSATCTLDVCKFLNEANQYGAFYNFITRKAPELMK
jgi:Transcriptional regulator/sugar kinase